LSDGVGTLSYCLDGRFELGGKFHDGKVIRKWGGGGVKAGPPWFWGGFKKKKKKNLGGSGKSRQVAREKVSATDKKEIRSTKALTTRARRGRTKGSAC